MFISNVGEAYDNCIYGYTDDDITKNSKRFDCEVGDLLDKKVPLNEWVMRLGAHMDADNAIDMFNRQGLTYIE